MTFVLVHWDIRGARANSTWLCHSFFCSADIICLQETFLSSSCDFNLQGKTIIALITLPVVAAVYLLLLEGISLQGAFSFRVLLTMKP